VTLFPFTIIRAASDMTSIFSEPFSKYTVDSHT
jgi:hypothetical protein